MNLSSTTSFSSFDNWNDFLRALRSSGRILRVAKPGLFSRGKSKYGYSPNQLEVGTTSEDIRGLPTSPEAIFGDGTSIQLTPATYKYFEIAYRQYNIIGVS